MDRVRAGVPDARRFPMAAPGPFAFAWPARAVATGTDPAARRVSVARR
jgi:hypothetical protein